MPARLIILLNKRAELLIKRPHFVKKKELTHVSQEYKNAKIVKQESKPSYRRNSTSEKYHIPLYYFI